MTTSLERDARRPAGRLQAGALAGARRASPRRGRRSDRRGRECRAARGGRRADRSSPSRRPALRRARPATGSRSRTPSSRRRSRGSCRAREPRGRGRRGRSRRRDRVAPRRCPRSSGRGTGGRARRSGRPGAAARAGPAGEPRRASSHRARTISRHGCMSPTDGARCAASRIRSQDVVGHLVRPEAPDVAPLGDHAIDRRAHVVGIAPAHRVGGALGGPGVVESRRRRRADESVWGGHAREQ